MWAASYMPSLASCHPEEKGQPLAAGTGRRLGPSCEDRRSGNHTHSHTATHARLSAASHLWNVWYCSSNEKELRLASSTCPDRWLRMPANVQSTGRGRTPGGQCVLAGRAAPQRLSRPAAAPAAGPCSGCSCAGIRHISRHRLKGREHCRRQLLPAAAVAATPAARGAPDSACFWLWCNGPTTGACICSTGRLNNTCLAAAAARGKGGGKEPGGAGIADQSWVN